MAATGSENSSVTCDGVYASMTLDRNDPFDSEGNGTAKFIGSGISKFDFHTIKAANATTSKRSSRPDLSKNEMLHMLCCLEGELQARDVVIAVLRNDRVKHYIHALRYKHLTLDDPQAALFRDKAAISGNHVSRQSSTAAIQADLEVRAIIEQQMESLCQVVTKQRHTQVRMVNVLSDSLENNQRMRQELEEEKRKHEHDTAQGDDITYGLEMERTKLKQELDSERVARKKLEKDMKKTQETLEFERGRQKQIVLLLLAERKKIIMKYIEERKRSEDLAQILSEEKQRSDSIAEGLEEESKKSLRMEAEMEKQTVTYENERKAWKVGEAKDEKRFKELELELAQLRGENEAFRKQLAVRIVAANQNVGAGGVSNKVRTVPDDVTSAVASSSIINVAKIVQPTATVSSVPVSGPTTGIARSISSGQCLRQQATTASTAADLIAAGAPLNSNQTIGVLFGTQPAKVLNTIINTTTTTPATLQKLSNSLPITQQHQQQLLAGLGGGLSTTGSSATTTTGHNQSMTATILRSSAAAAATVAPLTTAPIASLIASAAACSGRGMPPPIPPNKPVVPPKREPSISRIGSSGGIIGAVTASATNAAAQPQPSSILATAPPPSSVVSVLTNNQISTITSTTQPPPPATPTVSNSTAA